MKKCVKVLVMPVRNPDEWVARIKKEVNLEGLEGVVGVVQPDTIDITLFGDKDRVDEGVNVVEELVIRYNLAHKDMAHFSVEPFLKSEDFRGVVRFVKKSAL